MNIKLLPLAIAICLASCGDGIIKNKAETKDSSVLPEGTPAEMPKPVASDNKTVQNEKNLIGYWVGRFEPDTALEVKNTNEHTAWDYSNKINISIDEINGAQVKGHSVVAGNNRPFAGTVSLKEGTYSFELKEPGDDKYDGAFTFAVAQNDSLIKGNWQAFGKIKIPKRVYELNKKKFAYNPNYQINSTRYVDWNKTQKIGDMEDEEGYDKSYFATTRDITNYNASAQTLTKDEVANLKKADIFILRNAIYARHGFSFKNLQLRAFFDRQDWYIPISANIKSDFTEIEKKNIELLLRYEKNAKEYYDVFGRG